MSEPTVIDVPAKNHYEIKVDGLHAGLTAYVDQPGQRIFFHTEIDGAFEGQGLASKLVRAALTDVREKGLRLVPVCPYIAKWLTRNHDFDDIVDPVTPDAIAAVEAVTGQ